MMDAMTRAWVTTGLPSPLMKLVLVCMCDRADMYGVIRGIRLDELAKFSCAAVGDVEEAIHELSVWGLLHYDPVAGIYRLCGQVAIPFERAVPKPVYTKQVISGGLRKRVFERDAYRCKHCGGHERLSVDHIYPEKRGGTLEFDNLQTLCLPCNIRKGDRV